MLGFYMKLIISPQPCNAWTLEQKETLNNLMLEPGSRSY